MREFPCPLISPAELAAVLERPAGSERPVVLDVRRSGLDAGHLPDAVHLDIDTDLADPPGPGGRHPLPSPQRLEAALRRAGVRTGGSVVVHDEHDGSFAARAWWLLRWAGTPADRVAVLDGGFAAWVAERRPVTPVSGPAVGPAADAGDVVVQPGGMPVLDADGAAGVVASGGALLDARAGARYRGETEPLDPVAGHIPGALSAPAAELVGLDGRWLRPAVLAERFAGLGVGPGVPLGAYCGSGVTAAALVLAVERAGLRPPTDPVPLYVGSWSQWCSMPGRPIATGAAP